MRRYDIVLGVLLILSIIDFSLAAPVLVQEKRRAYVDVVPIPKDVAVLKKRGYDDLLKLMEEGHLVEGKPIESSDTHASSSSAQPVPDHESTNVEQAPAPNPASSTVNPDPVMELPSHSWVVSIPENYGPSSKGSSDNKWTWAKAQKPEPEPISNPRPSTDANANFDWEHWENVESPPRQKLEPEPISIPRPSTDSNANSDWDHWENVESPPRQKLELEPVSILRPSTDANANFDSDHWENVELPPR